MHPPSRRRFWAPLPITQADDARETGHAPPGRFLRVVLVLRDRGNRAARRVPATVASPASFDRAPSDRTSGVLMSRLGPASQTFGGRRRLSRCLGWAGAGLALLVAAPPAAAVVG